MISAFHTWINHSSINSCRLGLGIAAAVTPERIPGMLKKKKKNIGGDVINFMMLIAEEDWLFLRSYR